MNAFRNIGAGRTSRHSPWSLGTRVIRGTMGQAVGRQNSPAARMALVVGDAVCPGVRSANDRSGPAIHAPFQSLGGRSAVSNQPRPTRSLAPPAFVETRSDQ